MSPTPKSLYASRQAQWDAFHRWESGRAAVLSVEERVQWYASALSFCAGRFARSDADLLDKVSQLKAVQKKLAHLKVLPRDA
jgi:hypothetical protein